MGSSHSRNKNDLSRREFLKISSMAGLGLVFSPARGKINSFGKSVNNHDKYFPGNTWAVSSPEEQGIDPAGINAMLEKINKETPFVHSFLLIRHGYLVSEVYPSPFTRELPHILFSGTKSVTSALIGIAISEGFLIGVDQKVIDFFPEIRKKNPDPKLEKISLEHLLTMSTGQAFQVSPTPYKTKPIDWVEQFLANPSNTLVYEPGNVFMYTSGASHTMSAILQKATSRKLSEYAAEKLFKPLGIARYDWADDQNGITFGNSWLRLRPIDMAKFGYLYLNNGNWNGKQVIPADWVERSTRKHIETKGVQINAAEQDGYGYFFWMNGFGGYSVHGYGGQFVFVIPEMDLVAVFTGGYDDDVFDTSYTLMRDYILPAVKGDTLVPQNKEASARLTETIRTMANPSPTPVPALPAAAMHYSGKTFQLADGSARLSFTFKEGISTYHVRLDYVVDADGHTFTEEYDGGLDGICRVEKMADPVMGTTLNGVKGAWLDNATFEQTVISTDNVTNTAYTCHFENKKITLEVKNIFTGKITSKAILTADQID
jgi:CubicO group peptidase (beta-lactamase class C family)